MPRGGRRRAVRPPRASARCFATRAPDAEKIDVGVAAPQPLEQEAICYLLAEKAREGKIVARLKWGDPFVFDRGGAEALFLHEQGVRFEVVPGIPAGIGAAELCRRSAHLPGRRRHADVRARPRGRRQDARVGRLDQPRAARRHDRLLRRARSAAAHAERARRRTAGPADDSAALIYDGTLPTQETIDRHARASSRTGRSSRPIGAPAILVVGRVAALREHLRWFDARPLFGKRILVTRPREQAAELVELLEALGAEAIEAPMIRIAAARRLRAARRGVRDASAEFDWIVFTSAQRRRRVHAAAARPRRCDLRALQRRQAVRRRAGDGRAAGAARPQSRSGARRVPRRSGGAGARPTSGDVAGCSVFLPRADIGREVVADELRKQGAEVTEVVAYRTVVADAEREGEPDIYRMLLERAHRRRDVHQPVGGAELRRACSAPSRPPICCARPSSRRSDRSRPKRRRSTTFRRRSCRRSTRFRRWWTRSSDHLREARS